GGGGGGGVAVGARGGGGGGLARRIRGGPRRAGGAVTEAQQGQKETTGPVGAERRHAPSWGLGREGKVRGARVQRNEARGGGPGESSRPGGLPRAAVVVS